MLPRATTTPMIAKDSMLEWLKSQIVRRNVTVKDDIAAVVARAQGKRCSQATAVQGMSWPTAFAG